MGEPFTVDHFERWAFELELDNYEPWRVEEYFLAFADDLFEGVPIAWLVVPEGNAKTTNMAGLALYHCEFRRDASVPWAASARDQAEIGYQQAAGFVARSERLSGLFRCFDGYRRIRGPHGSKIQVFASDERSGDGIIFTLAILDEGHRHKGLGLYRTWCGKIIKRGGQVVMPSTAGEPGGEFEETREKMRQLATDVVRDGCFTRARSAQGVLHEWAVPEGGDVEDFELVAEANPASWITPALLEQKFQMPGMTLSHWRRFSCSLPTRAQSAAIEELEWERQAVRNAPAELPREIPAGVPVWGGLDYAPKYDTTAFVPVWVRDLEFRLLGEARILVPPMNGQMLDSSLVKAAMREVHERNPIEVLVMDMHLAEHIAEWAQDELGCEIVDRGQSNAFACLDYARFMEGLRERWLWHAGDPGLTRHVLNAIAKVLPQGETRFERPHQSRGVGASRTANPSLQQARVIDALTAAAMVHSTAVGELLAGDSPGMAWGPA